jgi:hypothetical protein
VRTRFGFHLIKKNNEVVWPSYQHFLKEKKKSVLEKLIYIEKQQVRD